MSGFNRRQYIPTYAEFFDALQCSAVPENFIRSALAKRGIITSSQETREKLAAYFNKLQPSYDEYQKISEFFVVNSKAKESCSTSKLRDKDNQIDISEVVSDFKHQLESDPSVLSAIVKKNGVSDEYLIEVQYTVHDYKLSEFQRNQDHSTQFVIANEGGGVLKIQSSGADKPQKWKKALISNLEKENQDIDVIDIDLSGITDSRKRLKFFDFVPKNINGFELKNISDVFFAELPEADLSSDDEDSEVIRQVPYKIKKAAFRGENLMNSPDLKVLLDQGFHLHRIVWESTRVGDPASSMYLMQMHFSDAEQCSGFLYKVLGHKPYENGKYSSKPYPVSKQEEKEITDLILRAATKGLEEIVAQHRVGAEEQEDIENGAL
ncbi:MAG: hypothetical protein VXW16_04690 [Bacteroidota bacterium]|nr:hypothetical protein [Bacteroidota bacterium]MEC8568910.1 hypothetical protein [Pseudomonadota bacterium]